MTSLSLSLLTICGIEELGGHRSRNVTHLLSLLDPATPDPPILSAFDARHRLMLRFHDDVEPAPDVLLPAREHVDAILTFGQALPAAADGSGAAHLLVHCHMGVSRSTAAMAMILAQMHPGLDEDSVFAEILGRRPQAWPNYRMVAHADDALNRGGRLLAAAGRVYAARLRREPSLRETMRKLGRNREIELADA
jgi:predicted protein tyrosine phosphatase